MAKEEQRIIELRVENFKRVSALTLCPNAGVTTVSGRNGQGKSSTLDAIQAALGGKDAAPSKPVKVGAEKAVVVVRTDDYTITRTFKPDGTSALKVESADGARYSSPQAMLDGILGTLSFDPLAFTRQKPKDQAETLRALAGLDFSAIDADRARVFEARTVANREVKRIEGELAGLPQHPDAPAEPVSIADLAAELSAAEATAANHRELEADVRDSERKLDETRRAYQANRARRAELEAALAKCDEEGAAIEAQGREWAEDVVVCRKKVEAHVVVDPAPIRERLASADATNAMVRANARRAEVAAMLERRQLQANELTTKIAEADAAKARMLREASFPLDGLSVGDDGVTLHGIPFEQASSAEQLRASIAIGAALHPKLRTMLVRDGALLDSSSLELLAEMAESMGVQILVERVGPGDRMGVVIEDGAIAGSEKAEAAE